MTKAEAAETLDTIMKAMPKKKILDLVVEFNDLFLWIGKQEDK